MEIKDYEIRMEDWDIELLNGDEISIAQLKSGNKWHSDYNSGIATFENELFEIIYDSKACA